jgi:hypothetical protein
MPNAFPEQRDDGRCGNDEQRLAHTPAATGERGLDVGECQLPGSTEHVFHSRSDRVLRLLFVPGQIGAGEYGPAVGRDGEPKGRWERYPDMGLGHRQYWTSKTVAREIAVIFGLRLWRDIETRLMPGFSFSDDARQLEESHLSERPLRERQIPY